MAYGRARRSTSYGEFWPGYVDVLSTLLLVVTFLMSVFMVSQFYVSQEASGKETALRRLTRQIAEITNLLSLRRARASRSRTSLPACSRRWRRSGARTSG
jgi:chemotaxis protein MotB